MPTYDYLCDACGHEFELFQGINEPKQTKCPKCKKQKLRRLIGTGAAIVFKGSGFYQTDYRSENYRKAAEADKPSSESSSSDSAKSPDSGKTTDSGKSSESSSNTKSSAKASTEKKGRSKNKD